MANIFVEHCIGQSTVKVLSSRNTIYQVDSESPILL